MQDKYSRNEYLSRPYVIPPRGTRWELDLYKFTLIDEG